MTPDYQQLKLQLQLLLGKGRVISDPLRTLAYGSDASFYRLVPKLVVDADSEAEVVAVIKASREYNVPVTFRAAGTSLSGQAVTDSVLLTLTDNWRGYEISKNGETIRLQPGVIGGHANRYLAPLNKKIGPDPASINACKVGGIAANNASGMCCGTAQNSYQTLKSMRVILADGTMLDTGSEKCRTAFSESHGSLLKGLSGLRNKVMSDEALSKRIRHKYRLKNTTGYSLNALIDFEDPFEILQHLMIGSEGTLGFIAEITYRTVDEHPNKATSLVLFDTIEEACRAVAELKATPVSAVELVDSAGLHSVKGKPGIPDCIEELGKEAAALLIETRALDQNQLDVQIEMICGAMPEVEASFTQDPQEYTRLWNVRKGLFPAVGAVRATGTTVIIEDVAFPVPQLAGAVRDLQQIFKKYDYHEAILFGHALEGNLHFVFTQDFSIPEEVRRYESLMKEVCNLVVKKYDGSLKAEHGTGRNMAPYVVLEWGEQAYGLMQEIKQLFDAENLLNPGVILNDDPKVHLHNLKPLPPANDIVDKCIECGFCESNCPSRTLTLTPRQRIVVQREISRLKLDGNDEKRLQRLVADYEYNGIETCAADGMCSLACPVGINTGDLTRVLRSERNRSMSARAQWVGKHFAEVSKGVRCGLAAANLIHSVLGSSLLKALSAATSRISGWRIPQWHRSMPKPAQPIKHLSEQVTGEDTVVYFPSCAARTMGPASSDNEMAGLQQMTTSLFQKAGFKVITPPNLDALCCGLVFNSKGLFDQSTEKLDELRVALMTASEDGKLPIYCDTSPCLQHMKEGLGEPLKLYDPVTFLRDYVMDRLELNTLEETVAIHPTCSTRRMGLDTDLIDIAKRCAKKVVVPDQVGCCGFGGDRGFVVPELNEAALKDLKSSLPKDCKNGYSTSRTCEIGLSLHSGIQYRSIVYLVNKAAADKN